MPDAALPGRAASVCDAERQVTGVPGVVDLIVLLEEKKQDMK
jgi:hypothetical protein